MSSATTLTQLLEDPRIWSAGQQHGDDRDTLATGFQALDRQLSGHGWPRGALIECLTPTSGIGELHLWLPAMRWFSHQGQGLFLLDPPHTPYSPALMAQGLDPEQLFVINTRDGEEQSWAMEQILRCRGAGMALAWPHGHSKRPVRRLQLAAEAGDSLGIHLMPPSHSIDASTAHLRLALTPLPEQLEVAIRRQRGGHPATITLPMATNHPVVDTKSH